MARRTGPQGPCGGCRDGHGRRDLVEPRGRGREGELQRNPGTATERRELGAAAGELPFTGLLLWLIALIGALSLAIGTRGRQLTAA